VSALAYVTTHFDFGVVIAIRSRLSSSEVQFHTENGRFAVLRPLGGLRATYDVHLRLIGKRVVDFPLVLMQLFAGVTTEALRAKID